VFVSGRRDLFNKLLNASGRDLFDKLLNASEYSHTQKLNEIILGLRNTV